MVSGAEGAHRAVTFLEADPGTDFNQHNARNRSTTHVLHCPFSISNETFQKLVQRELLSRLRMGCDGNAMIHDTSPCDPTLYLGSVKRRIVECPRFPNVNKGELLVNDGTIEGNTRKEAR